MEHSQLFIIILSLVFSAFFSGMEIAFVSANKLKIELDRKLGFYPARIMSYFNKNQSKFISTMLVGNNIALVVYGIFMAESLESIIGRYTETEFAVFLIQTVLSTLLILLVAEFLPKALFRINSNRILTVFAVPVALVYYLLFPIVFVTILISNFILEKFFKVDPKDSALSFGMVDLDNFLKEATAKVEDNKELETEVQIFQNALDFSKVKARECMIPRTEIEAMDENGSIGELKEKFIDTGYTKILIYRDNIDNIIGYTHSFELFKKPKKIKHILLPITAFPETVTAHELLKHFIREKKSIAVVVDEFGGTSGIVTIEDVVEELFGDIEDEHDYEELIEKEVSGNEYLFSARHEIDYLNEKFRLGLPTSEDYETLAGYIISISESIPSKDEKIETGNHTFTIKAVSKNKIEVVHLLVKQGEAER